MRKRLSLVTARVVRQHEKGGKKEQYLVKHTADERPDEKVIKFLTPFAKEPVFVVRSELLKSRDIYLLESKGGLLFYKFLAENTEELDNGKKKKELLRAIVQANSFSDALSHLVSENSWFCCEVSCVKSIVRMNVLGIIE